MIRSLQSNDSREREAAVLALMRNGSTRIVPLLLEAAHDSRSERRVLACRYLIIAGTKPEDVVPILVAAASDTDPSVRFEAASSFGRLVDGGVFGGVAQLVSTPLTTTAVDLRTASIAALRRLLQDQEATDAGGGGRGTRTFRARRRGRPPTLRRRLATRNATYAWRRRRLS